ITSVLISAQRLGSPRKPTHFPSTTLFRSQKRVNRISFHVRRRDLRAHVSQESYKCERTVCERQCTLRDRRCSVARRRGTAASRRSEEHTSELQSRVELVCRLMLAKKKNHK